MENFFGHGITAWEQDHDSLHVYALPSAAAVEAWSAYDGVIEGFAACARQPRPFLHATVQRLPWYADRLPEQDLTRLGEVLGARIAEVPAFRLTFGAPEAGRHGVVLTAQPSDAWDHLVATVRDAAVEALGPQPPLGRPPFGPHVSLGYGVADGDSDDLQRQLDAVPAGEVVVDVETAHLLAVHMRPDRGCFEWDPLRSYPLASA